jgi:outer membrane protein OmpA-like peptidoglycan-associated protein
MRTLIIGFGVFLLYAVPARWHYVCGIQNLCEDKATKEMTAANSLSEIPARTKDLSLMVEDSTILANFEQFGFQPNSAELQLTDNNKDYLKGIADFMKANPDARLNITGYYYTDEKNSSGMYDNLGLARAAAIRDYLAGTYRFDENRFKLDYESVKKGASAYLDTPVSYNISFDDDKIKARGVDEEEFAEASYTFTRMTFSDINFDSGSDVFTPSKNFITYADSVKTYLEKNPTKKLKIIGHTDSDGTDVFNSGLAFSRARNVVVFLSIKTGIDSKRISAISKGEERPIVKNDSDMNKKKNRRVEVIIE